MADIQAQSKQTSNKALMKVAITFLIVGIILYGVGLVLWHAIESYGAGWWLGLAGMAIFIVGLILIIIYFIRKLISRKSEP